MADKSEKYDHIQPAGVRERLLEKGLELFTNKGYGNTSVREIVAAAGVTKPVLYYYFGNKEGLYLELMNSTYATFNELLCSLGNHCGDVRERLIHFCTGIFDGFVENVAVVRLIYAIYFGPPQGAPHFPHEQYFEKILGLVGGVVREGILNAELRRVDEKDATWAVVAALSTVMEQQLCHLPPRIDRDGLVRILQMIIDGLTQEK